MLPLGAIKLKLVGPRTIFAQFGTQGILQSPCTQFVGTGVAEGRCVTEKGH